ncbi:MAG: alpha-D-ribose 1-methylphosphonate 5-triphosphate diphosphatase [Hyphomicrobiales bacterium]
MMDEQIFTNATIVAGQHVITAGTVCLSDGRITDIDDQISQVPSATDFEGDLLLPGLVELHTDNVEKHMMPRPGVFWPAEAALLDHDRVIAAAGITTVFDAVCLGEIHRSTGRAEILEDLAKGLAQHTEAGNFLSDHRLHLRCEISAPTLTRFLDSMIDHVLVGLVSIMDHTPGQRQFVSIDAYAQYYQGKYGMSDEGLADFIEERKRDREQHNLTNRAHVVKACRERGLSLASHDDATLAHVEDAVADNVVIAEFPTTIEAARASHDNGLAVMMGAPNIVRGKSHSGNISARDLAGHKVLDIISSDYVPPSLLYATLMLEELHEHISLPDAIAMVTSTPAKQAGFDDRGKIAPGLRADVIRVRRKGAIPIIRDVWRGGVKIA